jgi:hypothetical protein
MKISSTGNFRSIVGKIMMGFVLVSMIGSIDVVSAIGKDYERHDNGRYEKKRHAYGHDKKSRRHHRPYGYYGHSERAYYPPPPVVWVPPPPPGIRIFFPPIFIHN